MPWNSDVVYLAPPLSDSLDLAVVTERVIPESFQYPRPRDLPNPWRGLLEKVYATTSQQSSRRLKGLSLVPLAVDNLMTSLGAAYADLCPEGRGVCRAMEDLGALTGRMRGGGGGVEVEEEEGKGVGVGVGGVGGSSRPSSPRHLELDVFAVRRRGKVKVRFFRGWVLDGFGGVGGEGCGEVVCVWVKWCECVCWEGGVRACVRAGCVE